MDDFNYEEAKRNAERMLEVIERDPQAQRWTDQVQGLVPIFYSLAVTSLTLSIVGNNLLNDSESIIKKTP